MIKVSVMEDDKSECNRRGWVSVEERYLRVKCGRGVGGMMSKDYGAGVV